MDIEISSLKITVFCRFNYPNGCSISWTKAYDHAAFNQQQAIAEAKATYNSLEQYTQFYKTVQPALTIDW